METIGIITYHAAHNYGSVLQAYATQQKVADLGYHNQIINYRMKAQKDYYCLYRTRYGLKSFLKDLSQIPIHSLRKNRWNSFERFINEKMILSEICQEPEDVYRIWDRYPLIISGSDQIWNKHSEELKRNSWEYMMPYLLKDYLGFKISYSSSIANMNPEEMDIIMPYLRQFSSIAVREQSSIKAISNGLNIDVNWTLDPTFLLDSDDWTNRLDLKRNNENYMLFYSLGGPNYLRGNIQAFKTIANKNGLKIILVTPFAYLPIKEDNIKNMSDIGPEMFLELLKNARMVITDSYHGTILSINFNRDVYSLCEQNGSHFRKTDILEKLHMEKRIIYDINDIIERMNEPINYKMVNDQLYTYRKQSIRYLKNSLSAANV